MKRTFFILIYTMFLLFPIFSFGNSEGKNSTDLMNSTNQRIVSLSPAVTEILFAIDAEASLVARTDFCTWPPEAESLPSVGGFDGKSISLETLLAFEPDLVCIASGMHDYLIQPLEQFGIDVFVSSADSISEIFSEIQELSLLVGCDEEGKNLIQKIQEQLEQAEKIAINKPMQKVYWEVSSSPYFSCGKFSFITEAIELAGAKNIFGYVPQSYPQVSEESIIASEADVIIFPDYTESGDISFILQRPNWQQIPAVAKGRVYAVNSDLFSRPGPRIGEMVLTLVQILYEYDVIE